MNKKSQSQQAAGYFLSLKLGRRTKDRSKLQGIRPSLSNKKELLEMYEKQAEKINSRLESFKNLRSDKYLDEFMFCLLTPASNAKKCWHAVELLRNEDVLEENKINEILKKHTRFHNNKTRYLMNALCKWKEIKTALGNENRKELRNFLADNIEGYGLKEAGHFLRNIGKSDNQIAILDRHILRNLKYFGVIEKEKIRGKKEYLEVEDKFLKFADELGIAADELDLLFWGKETGEVFK